MSNPVAPPAPIRPRSTRPDAPFAVFAAVAAVVTAARFAFIAWAPPSGDELYIWNGARDLQLCYRDFPLMVPLLVHLGTMLGGDTAFGIRLAFPLLFAALALHAYGWAARERGPRAGFIAGTLALGAFPPASIGAVYAATDSALAVAWYFATYFLWRATRTDRAIDWLWTGMALLAGCLSKYLMLFWVGGAFVYLLMDPERRRFLLRPPPYAVLAIGALSAVPFFIWNAQNEWTGLLFQVSERHDVKPTLKHIAGMVGGQIALATPILFALVLLSLRWAIRRRNDGDRHLLDALVVFSLATLVFLMPIGVFVRVSPLWPAVGYLPAAVLVALWACAPQGRPARLSWTRAGIALSVALVLLLHAAVFQPQALFAAIGTRLEAIRPTKLSARHVRAFYGWTELAARIDRHVADDPTLFVASPKATFCSFISYYTKDQIPTYVYREILPDGTVLGEKAINSLNQTIWQDTSGLAGRNALFVSHQPASPSLDRFGSYFREWGLLEEVPVIVKGEELRRFYIFRGIDFAGWPASR